MIKSMTGYGRGQCSAGEWDVSAEIKAVNHRYTDINIRTSRQLMFMENDIKKLIQKRVSRGKIDVSISCERRGEANITAGFDEAAFKAYIELSRRLADDYKLYSGLNVADILGLPGVLNTGRDGMADDSALSEAVFQCVDKALEELITMRSNEGRNLYANIYECLEGLRAIVDSIKSKADGVVAVYKDKLAARIQEMIDDTLLDMDRLMLEIAIYADKSDIREEITRLYSHIDQFSRAIDDDIPVGRKLDFITQEIYREFNTIASKATDVDIINGVIEAKAVTEKIREQIQNIE
jgi:uncharacterized protein (TIGR00255 family)